MIDTLIVAKKGEGVNAVKVYGGELLLISGSASSGIELLHSNNRGTSFTVIMDTVSRPIPAVPGKGVYSSCLYRLDDTSSANRVWVVNGSELVYDDTVGVPDASIPYFAVAMYINPVDPSVWILKIDRSTIGGPYEYLFMSADRGTHWDLLPIPMSTYNGSARRIYVRFDYSDPKAWFVGVNGRDVFGGPNTYEWHRTADNGQTFARVTDDLGYMNGMFGSQTSVTFPNRLQLPWQRELSRGNIVIFHHETNVRDTIEWTKNIYSSLFPNNDNATVDIYAGVYMAGSDESAGFTYHPEHPGTFVVGMGVDSLVGTTHVKAGGVIATTDTSRTWKWIIKPEQQLNLQSMSIDPVDGAVYICVNGYRDPADKLNGFVLIRVTPLKETSVAAVGTSKEVSVYPNPASSEVTVEMDGESDIEYIRIIDPAGNVHMEMSTAVWAGNNGVLDVNGLVTGLYTVTITRKDHTLSAVRLAVIH
ncbi:MAG: T9SS type A sorting domain-containing protein [Bacteroidetes bacterium]|nr:T9SS type A sorting domain-containing protein [Bacteroidota bacterium]